MSCVRYKFKSSLEYDKVTFEGLQLCVGDLRKRIMSQKKLGMSDDFTLQIMDAQSKKIYSNDSEMVPRNTSVIIMRIPVTSSHKLPKTQIRDNGLPKENGLVAEQLKKTGDLAGADASEEEKVLAMMSQAGEDYNPATYAKYKSRHGQGPFGSHLVKQPPPPNYVCHRCGLKGHWIKFCPTNGDPTFDNPRIKMPSGIPKSHMVPVSANTKGAMIDRQGNLVKRVTDVYANDNKSKSAEPIDTSVPPELTCNICKELIRDAVIIPCCGESFCDECIREYLLENDFKCFACEEDDVSPDSLVANKRLRNDAKNFQTRLTQKKRLAVTRGLPSVVVSHQTEDTPINQSGVLSEVPEPIITNPLVPLQNVTASVNPLPSEISSLAVPPSVSPTPSSIPETLEEETVDSIATPPPLKEANEQEQPPLSLSSTSSSATATRSKSPVTTINIPITKPIALSSSSAPHHFSAFTAPISMVTAPLMTAVPHPLTLPAVPLVPQHTLFPQAAAHAALLPLSVSVPQVAATLSLAPPKTHPTANSLLLQAATMNSQSSMDPASMARLTELLTAAADRESRPKSKSPPPLTLEEFYRQQKVLRGLNIPGSRSRSRSVSSSSSYSSTTYSSRSRSSTPRRRRSKSRSFTPDRYGSRHHQRYSKRSKRRRGHSPDEWEEQRSRPKRRNRSSDRETRKVLKRKRRPKASDYSPPLPKMSREEEFGRTGKPHKKKKRKHSRSNRKNPLVNASPSPDDHPGRDEERMEGLEDAAVKIKASDPSQPTDTAPLLLLGPSESKDTATSGPLDSVVNVTDPSHSKVTSADPSNANATALDPPRPLTAAPDPLNSVEESSSNVCSPSATRISGELNQLMMADTGSSKVVERIVNHLEETDSEAMSREASPPLPSCTRVPVEEMAVRLSKKRKHKQKERGEDREKRRRKKHRHVKEEHWDKARRKKSRKRD